MTTIVLGAALIFAAIWFACAGMTDWDWSGAFLYMLSAVAFLVVIFVGVALIGQGLSR